MHDLELFPPKQMSSSKLTNAVLAKGNCKFFAKNICILVSRRAQTRSNAGGRHQLLFSKILV